FPSYWNLVAFYLYFLALPVWLAAAIVVVLSVLTFVPWRYLYSTQPGRLHRLANILAAPWAGLLVLVLLVGPDRRYALVVASLYFPVFYLAVSWWVVK